MGFINKYPSYKWLLAIGDIIIVNTAFVFALQFGFYPNMDLIDIYEFSVAVELLVFFIYSFFMVFIFQYYNLYKRQILFTHSKQLIQIIKSITIGILLFLVFQFSIHPYRVMIDSRLLYVYFVMLSILLFAVYRIKIIRYLIRKRWLGKIVEENIAIVGAGGRAKLLATKILDDQEFKSNVVGFIDDNVEEGSNIYHNIKVIGGINELASIYDKYNINSLYIGIDNLSKNRLFEIMSICLDYRSYIYVSSEILDILPEKFIMDKVRDLPIIRANNIKDGIYVKFIKRVVDTLVSALSLIILSPFLLIIASIIKLSSKGPFIFKQLRIGKNGLPFQLYKFRTMSIGSDDDEYRKNAMLKFMKGINGNNENQKVINNLRVTKFGKFLRRYSLDEFPQLFNVIRGEMSLIGPRPSLPYEVESYDFWHKKRLLVLPGCTGLWQVSGRSELSFDDSVILDIYYTRNISPWLDLRILFKTVPVIIFGYGGK